MFSRKNFLPRSFHQKFFIKKISLPEDSPFKNLHQKVLQSNFFTGLCLNQFSSKRVLFSENPSPKSCPFVIFYRNIFHHRKFVAQKILHQNNLRKRILRSENPLFEHFFASESFAKKIPLEHS
jgi:hypothetical protein